MPTKMNQQDPLIMLKNCVTLIRSINWRELLPKLVDYGVFNKDDEDVRQWMNHIDEYYYNGKMYYTILTHGPNAFAGFVRALIDIGQEDLATLLKPEEDNGVERIDEDPDVDGNNASNDRNNIIEEESSDRSDDEGPYDPIKQLKISVKKSTKFMELEGKQCYDMRSPQRGEVFIVNNITFEGEFECRKGAMLDSVNLKELFEQMKGFKVHLHEDLTEAEILQCLAEFAAGEELQYVDSIFVFIMTHGNKIVNGSETVVFGIDGKPITETTIINQFTATNCKAMANKPKILVFQNCRGERTQETIDLNNNTISTSVSDKGPRLMQPSSVSPNYIREYSDIMVAHATLPGHEAYRDVFTGSWYIQILCKVFMNQAHNMELHRMFQMIDRKFANTIFRKSQTSTITCLGFNKRCHLNPGC